MAKALRCEFELDIPELSHTSEEAKDLVRHLLCQDPDERFTATESLAHPWLSGADIYIDVLHELETTWMRSCLARRRYRAQICRKTLHVWTLHVGFFVQNFRSFRVDHKIRNILSDLIPAYWTILSF